MNKIQWIIDTILLERHDEGYGFLRIDEAAKELGHSVSTTKYRPFSNQPDLGDLDKKIPTVFYGSCEFISQVERCGIMKHFTPGAYLKRDALRYSDYCYRYNDFMLNSDFFMLPYGEIKRRAEEDDGILPCFIRPDVVTKSFPGHVVNSLEEVMMLSTYDKIYDNEMCVIAPAQEIKGEYRHVICRNELIAQSQYRRDGKLDIRTDVDPKCQRLAKWISREEYQPDSVYVVDTALLPSGECRIIEFNAFSCSGLYAMDTRRIVEAVSFAADWEFKGEGI